jgi:hypothetical protein
MAQKLRVLQSLWAMETRGPMWPDACCKAQPAMIRDAGFDWGIRLPLDRQTGV